MAAPAHHALNQPEQPLFAYFTNLHPFIITKTNTRASLYLILLSPLPF
jgi:hypothetical protein